ncbi:DDE_3 domain-containing protein [Trichonephila clavipes]|nr:DDE_3 domain-containing protein [Trichonephila clavipes]
MLFYEVELLYDWNVDRHSWKYPRNLESPRVSSPGIGNDSKMMAITDLHVQSVVTKGHIYRDVILEQHVRLFRGAMGAEFLFMDDNARPHRANIVDECLQSEDITRMDWPAYSPDLNPIEHVWDMLGPRIVARQPTPTCLSELRRALLDEWCSVPQDQIDNLILSMPRRCVGPSGSERYHLHEGQAQDALDRPDVEKTAISDESRFNLSSDDNCVRVWRPRGERHHPALALQRHTAPAAGVMVWSAIAYNTWSPLVLIRGTMIAQRQCSASHGKVVTRLHTATGRVTRFHTVTALPEKVDCDFTRLPAFERFPQTVFDCPIEHIWDH